MVRDASRLCHGSDFPFDGVNVPLPIFSGYAEVHDEISLGQLFCTLPDTRHKGLRSPVTGTDNDRAIVVSGMISKQVFTVAILLDPACPT